MSIVWPPELQQYLDQEGYQLTLGETVVRSDMDVGPAKTRRRFTKGIDQHSAQITIDQDMFDIFQEFYKTITNGGALRFEMLHPITRETAEFRFLGPPSFKPLGGGWFQASFTLEEMP